MSSLSNFKFLRLKDDDGKSGRKSPRPPKSPRSPKPPKSPNFSKIEQNADYLNQCEGCNNVDVLIRRNLEYQKNGRPRVPTAILHNSFEELDNCSHKCDICRVFRQALVLAEVTSSGVKELQRTPGEVLVHWRETTTANLPLKVFLEVEVKGPPGRTGVVNCVGQKEASYLALSPDGLDLSVIKQAKQWLDTCLNDHIGSCGNLGWSRENPRLLIEILSPTSIQLVRLGNDQKAGYVALSYCWGMDTLSESQKEGVNQGKTLIKNLDRRLQPFSTSGLPTTVRDALRFIHAIGIRYAWIDTLCIVQDKKDPVQGKPEGVETMHLVYSNALFTLNSCVTTRAIESLFDTREAWTRATQPCRLGERFLTTPDMSLNELRLRSPLAGRAWTLQEERLSPRMLYLSSSRVYWSCAKSQEMEMKPTHGQKPTSLNRPFYAASDNNQQMPLAQEFLLACYSGKSDLHSYWADIVKSYASRSMSVPSDRLKALSGVAARYLSASKGDQYLAGLWARHLAEGLSWRVHRAIDIDSNDLDSMAMFVSLPSWSWSRLPPPAAIETNATSARSPDFYMLSDGGATARAHGSVDDFIKRGEEVKEICVTGRTRMMWGPSSRRVDWSTISTMENGEEAFTFTMNPEQDMHAVHALSGRILVYEDRKQGVVGQLDLQQDVRRIQSARMHLKALELCSSTMLLLEYSGEGEWRRVGAAWDVREDYFASAECETLILR